MRFDELYFDREQYKHLVYREKTLIWYFEGGQVQLLDVMPQDITIFEAVVMAARVSTAGEPKSKGPVQDFKLFNYLWENKHLTPFEMVEFKFRVEAPLFTIMQHVRHRTQSFNVASGRYQDLTDKQTYYCPSVWRKQSSTNKQGSREEVELSKELDYRYWQHMENSTQLYNDLKEQGVANELARLVLPQALMSSYIFKTNLRNLLAFLKLRAAPDAQYEIRVMAESIYDILYYITSGFDWRAFNDI